MTPKKPKKAEPGNRLEAIENTQEKASVDTPADTYSVEAHTQAAHAWAGSVPTSRHHRFVTNALLSDTHPLTLSPRCLGG